MIDNPMTELFHESQDLRVFLDRAVFILEAYQIADNTWNQESVGPCTCGECAATDQLKKDIEDWTSNGLPLHQED